MRRISALVLLSAAGLGLGPASADAAESTLKLSDAWMRVIVPSRPAAGYFKLMNNGDKTIDLTAAASPDCGKLMLHKSVHENGVEKMMMVKSVPVPAHGSISFEPGGYHLMCMSPSANLKPGASTKVTLSFSDGGGLTADFPVKNATGN